MINSHAIFPIERTYFPDHAPKMRIKPPNRISPSNPRIRVSALTHLSVTPVLPCVRLSIPIARQSPLRPRWRRPPAPTSSSPPASTPTAFGTRLPSLRTPHVQSPLPRAPLPGAGSRPPRRPALLSLPPRGKMVGFLKLHRSIHLFFRPEAFIFLFLMVLARLVVRVLFLMVLARLVVRVLWGIIASPTIPEKITPKS
jgi:hypothetical protein